LKIVNNGIDQTHTRKRSAAVVSLELQQCNNNMTMWQQYNNVTTVTLPQSQFRDVQCDAVMTSTSRKQNCRVFTPVCISLYRVLRAYLLTCFCDVKLLSMFQFNHVGCYSESWDGIHVRDAISWRRPGGVSSMSQRWTTRVRMWAAP